MLCTICSKDLPEDCFTLVRKKEYRGLDGYVRKAYSYRRRQCKECLRFLTNSRYDSVRRRALYEMSRGRVKKYTKRDESFDVEL